jgi:methionyl-tRNA formyltransferase
MGTPDLAAASLRALLGAPDVVVTGVVSQPDRPKGRDLAMQPSPVKELATQNHLPVLQPLRAREPAFVEALRDLAPDLIAVAAYGQILPAAVLQLPRLGCVNVHTSLLPKYRGASPIQQAILNGDRMTGVTIMRMDAGLDTGDILSQEEVPIHLEDTAETLHDRLAQTGAALLVRTIPDYANGRIQPRPQPAEGASYAPRIRKEDGLIDWGLPAPAIGNRVRAFAPWPGAFTHFTVHGAPHLLKIWKADVVGEKGEPGAVLRADKQGVIVGCGQAALNVRVLQLEGSRRMPAQEFLAGHPMKAGQKLG